MGDKAEDDQDEEEEEERERGPVPSYPFPADFSLDVHQSHIQVCEHFCKNHPGGTRAICVFFPGVHGGVGPCRTPGSNFDENALFPTVARRLVEEGADVDCYRCSWPYMCPTMEYGVGAACRVLHHALLQALAVPSNGDIGSSGGAGSCDSDTLVRTIRVIFVGHSRGGAVAMQAAEVVARHFGPEGRGLPDSAPMKGLERCAVLLAGVCTLNGAINVDDLEVGESGSPFENLAKSRTLLICGEDDKVVSPRASSRLHEVLLAAEKRFLSLPGGTHDLFSHKAGLVEQLTSFIGDCA